VVAELVEASKRLLWAKSLWWWLRQAQPPKISKVVELVVAELVEASKRPLWEKAYGGGFDRLSHRSVL